MTSTVIHTEEYHTKKMPDGRWETWPVDSGSSGSDADPPRARGNSSVESFCKAVERFGIRRERKS